MIILPAESKMHNAERDFGNDIDDAGDKLVFRLPFLFSIPIPMLLIAGFLPMSMSSDRDARSMDVSVSAYLLCSLIA